MLSVFLSVGLQAIAKYLKYFAFLGSRPGTNHALAEKERTKAKPRFPRQIGERPGASGGGRVWLQFLKVRLVTIFQGASGSKL